MKNIVCFFLLIILCQDAHSQFNPDNVSWHRDNSFIRVKRIHADIFRVNSIRENGVIVVKDFYLDGTLRGIGQDKNGEMHGTYVGYYKDGSLKDSGTFHKGYKWGEVANVL